MRSSKVLAFLIPAVLVAVAFAGTEPLARADAYTRVFVNGQLVPVRFNDGDSFRIFAGPYQGRQSRLGGYNTLESFGPVHQWGTFHPYEMFVNAKMATIFGKRGTWHCFTGGETDGYGRLLLDCPDLAVAQIRRGLAHAMNVDDSPSRPEYIRAQQEAIRERRGMWAHGAPAFVLSSLHSNHEDPERDKPTYNRLVSTRDGHSEKWEHTDVYDECQWVCYQEIVEADPARVEAFARTLREDREIAPLVRELTNTNLVEIVSRWVRREKLPEWITDEETRTETEQALGVTIDPRLGGLLEAKLGPAFAAGALGTREVQQGACHLYVAFERRYGRERAGCLRGHGTPPPGTGRAR